jgi:pantetheine-phosphate adenylyltransferase
MRLALYAGTFDPVTHGHLDIAARALRLFDELVIAVARDGAKSPLFTAEERVALLQSSLDDIPGRDRVRVTFFDGLLVDYAASLGACAVVRGLRAVSDFEYEFQMALMNRNLSPDFETLFLMPKDTYTYLSSSMIKEIVRLGGNAGSFVPAPVLHALHRKFSPA